MKLYFKEIGQGHPLFIIHGVLGSGDNWLSIANKLGNRFRCILPDLRNHGRSPRSDIYGHQDMADDIMELADTLNIEKFSILGHSMGARLSMTCSLLHPERIENLIAADMAPRMYPGTSIKGLVDILLSVDLDRLSSRAEVNAALSHEIPREHIRAFLLKSLAEDEGKLSWRFNLQAIHNSFNRKREWPVQGKVFNKPTLFLRGEQSKYIRDEDYPVIHEFFPLAKIVVVPGAGHWVHIDNPQFVTQSVEDFFA